MSRCAILHHFHHKIRRRGLILKGRSLEIIGHYFHQKNSFKNRTKSVKKESLLDEILSEEYNKYILYPIFRHSSLKIK